MLQDTALSILKTGANAFLTGEPGAGKTHTINRYIDWLRRHGIEPAVTASTGIAATHIGGATIHSWSGIGIRGALTAYEVEALHEREPVVKRVRRTSVLIIEEISMLDAEIIESVDAVLRSLRGVSAPFGGMQVVFVGDFFQLPPVQRERDMRFAFTAGAWAEAKPVTCYVTEQYRQDDDAFLSLLSALRHQDVRDEHVEALHGRVIAEPDTYEITATKLYTHNADVDRINDAQLASIDAPEHRYIMQTAGPAALTEQLKRGCLSPDELILKEGAVVMCTKNNFEAGFVNGTLGTVIGFNEEDMPVIETRDGVELTIEPMEWAIEEDGAVRARITQVPLRLAWAITVHKSQGMSMDAALIDLSRAFEYGQGYVALSRVRALSGLHLLGFNERALAVHPEVAARDAAFREHSARVAERFGALSDGDKRERERAFIRRCGGSVEEVKRAESAQPKAKQQKGATYRTTCELLKKGKSVAAIARERGLTGKTILGHIEKLFFDGSLTQTDIKMLLERNGRTEREIEEMYSAFRDVGHERVRPAYDLLDERYSFEDLRLARLLFAYAGV